MRLRLVADAAVEPVSLADAKLYARQDLAEDDPLFTALIKAARRYVEKQTGLALITQSWVQVLDRWPDGAAGGLASQWWDGVRQGPISMLQGTTTLEVTKRPFQSMTGITLRDAYGALTTVDPSIYSVEVSGLQAHIIRKLGQIWPFVILANSSAIEIAFKAGYGDTPDKVPEDLVLAIKMLIKHWYDNREPIAEGRAANIPLHIGALLQPYQNLRI